MNMYFVFFLAKIPLLRLLYVIRHGQKQLH